MASSLSSNAASHIPSPAKLNLSGNIATEWKRFIAQWRNYEIATDLTSADDKKRVAIFLACAGSDARELFETFDLSDEARQQIDAVVGAFREHCIGVTNVAYERYVFNKRNQDSTETFDSFLADIKRLVKSCDYGTLEESIIKDRVVMGVRDDGTRRKLLQIKNLDLQTATQIALLGIFYVDVTYTLS